ncbi:MAG TPA: glycerophosphodiester phosphodiesterase family protein [Bryobacteraceae bacterium]|nr:glycerophosphodiester phosphodiesterase family protein [Bryobacteraceae bacterium]
MRSIQVHGHRGARAVMPENSLAGFEYAIGVGVDAIEMDVHARDGVVVVKHDPPRPGEDLPTLDEVLSLARLGDFLFNIEAKVHGHTPENLADLVLARIHAHGLESRVIFQSFDFAILHRMRKLAPAITQAALWEGAQRSFVDIARDAETEIVAPEYVLVTEPEVRAAHEAGLQVIPWTPNAVDDWKRLIAAGVDGIITDNPAGLIRYVQAETEAPVQQIE